MRRLSQFLVLALLSASTLLYQFLQPAMGGKGQFLKASCHRGGLDRAALKGFFWIRLQWTRGDRKFPQVRGNMMLSWPRCESKARWKAPIKTEGEIWGKNRKKIMPNGLKGMKFT
jgi:hypothetical protein